MQKRRTKNKKSRDDNNIEDYSIGIITALPFEYQAAKLTLRCEREISLNSGHMSTIYALGNLKSNFNGDHKLVLTVLPKMGTNSAAIVATIMFRDFQNIQKLFMIGIAGGIPNPLNADEHVRLGDIVVSNQYGIMQYDNIKDEDGKIDYRSIQYPPDTEILNSINRILGNEALGSRPWDNYIDECISRMDDPDVWRRPPEDTDQLHDFCHDGNIIKHPQRPDRLKDRPRIILGKIGSSNTLLKNAQKRELLKEKFGLKAVEMESSGIVDSALFNRAGYIVVRGISDYCDQHKIDKWQKYAAAAAAGFTRAIIEELACTDVLNKLKRSSVSIHITGKKGMSNQGHIRRSLDSSHKEQTEDLARNLLLNSDNENNKNRTPTLSDNKYDERNMHVRNENILMENNVLVRGNYNEFDFSENFTLFNEKAKIYLEEIDGFLDTFEFDKAILKSDELKQWIDKYNKYLSKNLCAMVYEKIANIELMKAGKNVPIGEKLNTIVAESYIQKAKICLQ